MLISHDHQFIFFKTRKTAGTSIETALAKHMGPMDVITQIDPVDEVQRLDEFGVRPRNFKQYEMTRPSTIWIPSLGYIPQRIKMKFNIGHMRQSGEFFNHMDAAGVRALVGEQVWNRYTKFAVVRNPFDVVISQYYYNMHLYGERSTGTLEDFIDRIKPHQVNAHKYCIDGKVVVDHLINFDHLGAELVHVVRDVIGISDFDGELPRQKGSFRKDKKPWQEVLSKPAQDKVAQIYAKDLEVYQDLSKSKDAA